MAIKRTAVVALAVCSALGVQATLQAQMGGMGGGQGGGGMGGNRGAGMGMGAGPAVAPGTIIDPAKSFDAQLRSSSPRAAPRAITSPSSACSPPAIT